MKLTRNTEEKKVLSLPITASLHKDESEAYVEPSSVARSEPSSVQKDSSVESVTKKLGGLQIEESTSIYVPPSAQPSVVPPVQAPAAEAAKMDISAPAEKKRPEETKARFPFAESAVIWQDRVPLYKYDPRINSNVLLDKSAQVHIIRLDPSRSNVCAVIG